MEKQIDVASLTLAISNSVSKQVDKLEALTDQIYLLTRPEDKGKIDSAKEAIKKSYDNYDLIVSTSIEKKAYKDKGL